MTLKVLRSLELEGTLQRSELITTQFMYVAHAMSTNMLHQRNLLHLLIVHKLLNLILNGINQSVFERLPL